MKLLDQTGTMEVNWVQIKTYAFLTDDNGDVQRGWFNSKLLQKTTTKQILPSTQVIHKVSIVHDCFDGHCKFEEANLTFMEEREGVERSTLVFKHNITNNRYLLNPFYLGNNGLDLIEPCEDL